MNTLEQKKEQIIELASTFCDKKLNEEYRQLCIELIMTLGDMPAMPLLRGKEQIWAAAVVYTVGNLNFLFDKSSEPHIPSSDIFDHFETKNSTVSAKSRMICDMLDLHRLDNRFATQSMIAWNPLNTLVMVDDMIVPIESLPAEIQEMVRDARARGEDISFRTEK